MDRNKKKRKEETKRKISSRPLPAGDGYVYPLCWCLVEDGVSNGANNIRSMIISQPLRLREAKGKEIKMNYGSCISKKLPAPHALLSSLETPSSPTLAPDKLNPTVGVHVT